MTVFLTVLLSIIGAIVGILLLAVLLLWFGPHSLTSKTIRRIFTFTHSVPPPNISEICAQITTHTDIKYPSASPENTLDLYLPTQTALTPPLILWIHGGGFIGGDKSDATYFAQTLASHGYAVATINYLRSPESQYPSALRQLNEAYAFLLAQAATYRYNPHKIILAGDSAGSHIATQAALYATNPRYRDMVDFHIDVPPADLAAILLYCGLLSMSDMIAPDQNPIVRKIASQVAHSYFGKKDWHHGKLAEQLDLFAHITRDFPPTFLTDGNARSFEPQARAMQRALETHNVIHQTLFFTEKDGQIPHEYQFSQNKKSAQQCMENTIRFLQIGFS